MSNLAREYVPITEHASGDAGERKRARAMLERVVRRASPIMRRRQLRVDALVEMAPPREVTIWGDNLNHGARIRLVLRVKIGAGRGGGRRGRGGGADRTPTAYRWIEDDQVFAVFLHELAHNERGPHDAKFYAVLNEMTIQAEMHMASNLYVCGRCVGGGDAGGPAVWRSPRRAAADAAMRRNATRAPRRRQSADTPQHRRANIPASKAAAAAAVARASPIVIVTDSDADDDKENSSGRADAARRRRRRRRRDDDDVIDDDDRVVVILE